MDDIKTIVKKIDEIYKTENHENLDTEKMLIENALTNYLSSQFEQLIKQKLADTWQKCPKCDGQGIVSKPPYVAGDVHEWGSTSAVHTCDVCNGAKIIKR